KFLTSGRIVKLCVASQLLQTFDGALLQRTQNGRAHPAIAGVAANDSCERLDRVRVVEAPEGKSELITNEDVRIVGQARQFLPRSSGRARPGEYFGGQPHCMRPHDAVRVLEHLSFCRFAQLSESVQGVKSVHASQC